MYSLDPFMVPCVIDCFWWWRLGVDDSEEVDEGELLWYDDGEDKFMDFSSQCFILCCCDLDFGELCIWSSMFMNIFFAFGLPHCPYSSESLFMFCCCCWSIFSNYKRWKIVFLEAFPVNKIALITKNNAIWKIMHSILLSITLLVTFIGITKLAWCNFITKPLQEKKIEEFCCFLLKIK